MHLIEATNMWRFIAGLGIFLLAMSFIEESLKELAGRRFKEIFRLYTKTPFRGVLIGTFATMILQSSSVVTLMLLSFVGAGIIEMRSALGVVFGSNLGTTFTGWAVAALGFKFDIQNFSYIFIGIGALFYSLLPKQKQLTHFFRFIAGVGLLLLGLEFMKASMSDVSQQFDITALQGYGIIVYFVFGIFFTAIIQSSSATMMITLAALNADILTLQGAASLIIGADLGTTATTLIGSIGGSPAKKQTSMAHFSFNLITDLAALLMITPLLSFVAFFFGEKQPLFSLVFFHSTFNVLGILAFLPFTGLFARFLEKNVGTKNNQLMKYISKVSPKVPEAAIEALNKEFVHLIDDIRDCNLAAFVMNKTEKSFEPVYEKTKKKLGETLEYLLLVQREVIIIEDSSRLNQLLKALDHMTRSAKAAKDIHHNIKKFLKSANPKIIKFHELFHKSIEQLYNEINLMRSFENQSHLFEEIARLKTLNDRFYDEYQQIIYDSVRKDDIEDQTSATLLNMNREIHSSTQYFLLALKDLMLSSEKAEEI